MNINSCGKLDTTLNLVGSKWTLPILHNLCSDNKGFNDLMRSIPGISAALLSQRLKQLVENNLVEKRIFDTNPPTVEYRLAPKGESLRDALLSLKKWAESN